MEKKPDPKDNLPDVPKPNTGAPNQQQPKQQTKTPGMAEPGTKEEPVPFEIRPSPPEENKGFLPRSEDSIPRTTDPEDTPGEDVVPEEDPNLPAPVRIVPVGPPKKPDPRKRRVSKDTKVRALKLGYYGERRRKAGDVFLVKGGDQLGTWMEAVPDDTPLRTQTIAEHIRSQDEARRMSGNNRKLLPNAADYTADERDHTGGDVL